MSMFLGNIPAVAFAGLAVLAVWLGHEGFGVALVALAFLTGVRPRDKSDA